MSDWTPKKEYRLAENTIPRDDLASLCDWLIGSAEDQIDGAAVAEHPIPRLTQGERVAEFEKAFAARVGSEHAVFVNSGSSALLLSWFLPIALDREAVAANRRVIVPAVSWPTSVMPAIQFGYEPVLCDAEMDTWGMDPTILRAMCEKAPPFVVLVVHTLGIPAKMEEVKKLRDEFGFLLIEDACAAFGSFPVGEVGELTTHSFYYGHAMSTIEGGMVCTNDHTFADVLKMLRAHGWTADCSEEFRKTMAKRAEIEAFREKFTFYAPGFNVRGTDLQATIGLSQLKRSATVSEAREKNHKLYRERFTTGLNGYTVQRPLPTSNPSPIGFGVLAASRSHRARAAEALKAKGIETRPICAGNIGRQPFWTAVYGKKERPVADRIHEAGFQLPCHPGLTPEDVGFIAETVLSVKP